MGDWLDFWVIMAVAIINAVIGFVQEGRAEKALAGIRGHAVGRGAARAATAAGSPCPAADLVPGDVVRLMPGDKVPADVRLLEAFQLRIDESALTGESVPSSKDHRAGSRSMPGSATARRWRSRARSSRPVRGAGLVTGTGVEHRDRQDPEPRPTRRGRSHTPLTRQLDDFGRILTIVILAMAAFMLLIGRFLHQMPFDELISATIGFAVAAIPEGLPALVTITLALGVQQMASAERDHAQAPRRRDARVGDDRLLRQDRHAHQERDDRAAHRDAGRGVRGHRARLSAGRCDRAGGRRRRGRRPRRRSSRSRRSATTRTSCPTLRQAQGPAAQGAVAGRRAHRGRAQGRRDEGRRRRRREHAGSPCCRSTRRTSSWRRSTAAPRASRAILVKGAPDRLLERSIAQRGAARARAARRRRAGTASIDELSAQGLRVLAAPAARSARRRRRHGGRPRATRVPRRVGHRRPAPARGDRRDRGLPRRGHQREDDHRRPRRHRPRDRSRDGARRAATTCACSPAPSSRR